MTPPPDARQPDPPLDPPLGERRLTRDSTDTWLGGVASGLAVHLGLPVLWVRLGFAFAALASGTGVIAYGALWMLVPSDATFERSTPGLEGASRQGRRPSAQKLLGDVGPVGAVVVAGVGVILGLQVALGSFSVLVPLLVAGLGVALLWRQADEAQKQRWFDVDGRIDPVRAVFGVDTKAGWARIGAGVALVVVAISIFAVGSSGLAMAREVWLATVLGIVGVGVVAAPWLLRLASDLGAERAERIRTQERADMAAHLHDSVLQTLALIQRNSADPVQVTRLARRQERELRAWLYTGDSLDDATLAGALRDLAARFEDEHGLVVDLVAVGDCEVTAVVRPVVQAVGEALTNVVKHAGVERVDVYVECGPGEVEVFVRDRGVGFDPDEVAEDRMGVSGSIVGRIERHGGRASVRSAPGDGTEVRIVMPLTTPAPASTSEEKN